jgi:hypothetical protein
MSVCAMALFPAAARARRCSAPVRSIPCSSSRARSMPACARSSTCTNDQSAPSKPDKDDWGRSRVAPHLRRVLMTLLADYGENIQPFGSGPTVRAVKLDLVQAEFLKSYTTEGKDERARYQAKWKAFRRAIDYTRDKITSRKVGEVEWVWLNSVEPPLHKITAWLGRRCCVDSTRVDFCRLSLDCRHCRQGKFAWLGVSAEAGEVIADPPPKADAARRR